MCPGDDPVEHVPTEQPDESEEKVGALVSGGIQMGHLVEDEGEDGRGEQRLEDDPDHAEEGLAVAEGDVAGAESVPHLAALPEL